MRQFPRAIEDTAFDLLNPAGTAFGPSASISQMARINRVNGFFFVKSSPRIAFIRGIYGAVLPIFVKIAGRVNSSNPVKHAEGFPDKPNSNFSPRDATVVTLPGRIMTLSNSTCAPNLL